MSSYAGRKIRDTFGDVLHLDGSNLGVDATLRRVEDGRGGDTCLELSTAAARLTGDLTVSGTVTGTTLAGSVTATGSTTARTLAARFAEQVNVRDWGAVGDGVTDDTTAIQAAITAVQPTKGRVYFPRGTYLTGSLTIGVEGQRYSCEIVGESWQGDIGQGDVGGTELLLKSGANGPLFTVASTAAPCRFENVFLKGQRTLQSGTSWGIYFTDYTTDATKARSAHFQNVRIEDFRSGGIYIGLLRNAGTLNRVTILNVGIAGTVDADCVTMASCNDWRSTQCDFGGATRHGIFLTGGGSSVWIACNSFVNTQYGMKIDSTALDNWFYGCSFDTNQQHGVVTVGSTANTTTTRYTRSFVNCRFNQNGLATNNTYSDLRLVDEASALVIGCFFVRGTAAATGGNLPQYHLKTEGTTAAVVWSGNMYRDASPLSYATASMNDRAAVTYVDREVDALWAVRPDTGHATLSSATPRLLINETDAASDAKKSYVDSAAGILRFALINDAESSSTQWMAVGRSGISLSYITLGGALAAEALRVTPVASQVNRVEVTGAATGSSVKVTAGGSDSNVKLVVAGKGTTGGVQLGTVDTEPLGFYGTVPIAKAAVTGSRAGNAALADLLSKLAALGLITDSTTA